MLDPKPPQLVVRRGPNPDHVYFLSEETSIAGREPINDVVLPDPEVSRRHARIVLRQGVYHVEDLSSTNGTYINGRRIAALTPLVDGDVVDFGETIRVVFYWSPDQSGLPISGEKLRPVSNKKYSDSSIFESSVPFPVPKRHDSHPPTPAPDSDPDLLTDEIESEAQRGDAETISELSGVAVSPPSAAAVAQTGPLSDPSANHQEPESSSSVESNFFADRRLWIGIVCAVVVFGLCACGGLFYFLDANYPNQLYSILPF